MPQAIKSTYLRILFNSIIRKGLNTLADGCKTVCLEKEDQAGTPSGGREKPIFIPSPAGDGMKSSSIFQIS
jgi:hypothetical protein